MMNMPMMKGKMGLMDHAAEEGREGPNAPPEESEGTDPHELDSNLVYEAAMKALNTPEGKQNVVKAVSGASDVGTAIGKMAGVLVTKITDELDARQMGISNESIFGAGGALAKVLTAIYQVANENGAEVKMEDSLILAYETAEADLESIFGGEQETVEPDGSPPSSPPMPSAGLMGA